MDYEGLDASRDVANEEKKHPWEVFPEDDSANSKDGGDKKREKTPEQREKEKVRREKRKARINTLKTWVKTHQLLTIGIALAVVAVIVGVVFGINALIKAINQANTPEEYNANGVVVAPANESMSIESAPTPEYTFEVVSEILDPILVDGIFGGDEPDIAKLEDNYNAFIKTVNSDYEKVLYELYFIKKLSLLGGTGRAEYLLQMFEERHLELDKKQRYAYLEAYIGYYYMIGDTINRQKYLDIQDEEFPIDEGYYDIDTGELITDPETIKKINDDFEKYNKTEEE